MEYRSRFNCEGKKSDRTRVEDYEDASYIGNINSKKYHLPSCSGLPNEENRVYFTTIDAAEARDIPHVVTVIRTGRGIAGLFPAKPVPRVISQSYFTTKRGTALTILNR